MTCRIYIETSVVSYLFKKMGKSVTYTDTLRFNYFIAKALIENQKITLLSKDIKQLLQLSSEVHYGDTIERFFRDIYYLDAENKWLDVVTSNILQMNHYQDSVLEYKKALAFYALFQSCMIKRPFNLFHRKNLELRTNEVSRSFGNKTSWDTGFDVHFSKFIKEANGLVFDSSKKCLAKNISVFDVDGDFDLVYLDPPYFKNKTTNETSDYYRIYHFLEGLTMYDEWFHHIDFGSNNLRLERMRNETHLTKSNIRESFELLFDKFQKSKIIVSYKYGGIPSIDWIADTLKSFKRNVYTISKHYKYALNHQNGDAKKNREVLIIGL